ncbi:tetratricopeptide repeat protein [Streptomyces sp. NPDC002817]|uniref:tetratricopeptide repeat protein n=1 Tax=Streptomyces sp. NPDC088357 TaxID=3154655 RepID=UPI00343762EB
MGRHEEALVLDEKTSEVRRRVLGPDHPNTLRTATEVALARCPQLELAAMHVREFAELMNRRLCTESDQRRDVKGHQPYGGWSRAAAQRGGRGWVRRGRPTARRTGVGRTRECSRSTTGPATPRRWYRVHR